MTAHGGVTFSENERTRSHADAYARPDEENKGVEFLLELVLYMLGEVISEAFLELVCRGLVKVIEALCEFFSAIG
jgi:predicted metallopeptidase